MLSEVGTVLACARRYLENVRWSGGIKVLLENLQDEAFVALACRVAYLIRTASIV